MGQVGGGETGGGDIPLVIALCAAVPAPVHRQVEVGLQGIQFPVIDPGSVGQRPQFIALLAAHPGDAAFRGVHVQVGRFVFQELRADFLRIHL